MLIANRSVHAALRWPTRLAFAVLACAAAIPGHAATETFNYPDGPLEGAGAVGEWAGPWQPGTQSVAPLGSAAFAVESEQLKIDFVDQAQFGYSGADVYRTLATPIASPSVYVSFSITPGEMGSAIAGSRDDGYAGLNFAFADGQANIGSKGPMFSVFEYFQNFGSATTVRIATSLDGVYDETKITVTNHTPGTTYQLVGRLDFDANGNNEQWTVWLDPTDETSAPQVVTERDLGYASIARAQMWQYIYNFDNTSDTFLDNLRLGSTWQSVTGPILPGDTDGDGDVDDADLGNAFSNYTGPLGSGVGNKTATDGDTDGDGDVDDADLGNAFAAYTGPLAASSVPEPASLTLLSIACLATLRRQRASA
jgi:hypothetical protein